MKKILFTFIVLFLSLAISNTASATFSVDGVCSSTHYHCESGYTDKNKSNSTNWTWKCVGFGYHAKTASCIENKPILGCMDDIANNYNELATVDDGSCTYDPIPLECTLPEVLNTAGDACITPEPLTCTAPQVLNEAGDACIDVVEPEPIVCVAPQILNTAGDACVDPTPEPLVCTEPQLLNESGDACVDPVVEPIVCVEPQTLVDGVCTDPEVVVEPTPEPVVEEKSSNSGGSSGSYTREAWAKIQASWYKPVYVWDVVKFGDISEDVKYLQIYLNNKGANLVVDGIYGPLTLEAFKPTMK